jgi:hypothetical protein
MNNQNKKVLKTNHNKKTLFPVIKTIILINSNHLLKKYPINKNPNFTKKMSKKNHLKVNEFLNLSKLTKNFFFFPFYHFFFFKKKIKLN